MGKSKDPEMELGYGEDFPAATIDDIYEELVSIKCAAESIESMIRGICETATVIIIGGVIIFFIEKFF